MRKIFSVLLVGVFTAGIGASAFATEGTVTKDKLLEKNTSSQHKVMEKTHKSHKAEKAESSDKSTSVHEVTK